MTGIICTNYSVIVWHMTPNGRQRRSNLWRCQFMIWSHAKTSLTLSSIATVILMCEVCHNRLGLPLIHYSDHTEQFRESNFASYWSRLCYRNDRLYCDWCFWCCRSNGYMRWVGMWMAFITIIHFPYICFLFPLTKDIFLYRDRNGEICVFVNSFRIEQKPPCLTYSIKAGSY